MFVWIYPLAPSRQQNLKKGTSLNEQLNMVIRQGRLRGARSGPLILGLKFPVGLFKGLRSLFALPDQDGESAVT